MRHRFGSPPFRSTNRATHQLWCKTLITGSRLALFFPWHRSNGWDGAHPCGRVSFSTQALPFSSAERRERSARWLSATCLSVSEFCRHRGVSERREGTRKGAMTGVDFAPLLSTQKGADVRARKPASCGYHHCGRMKFAGALRFK